MALAQPRVWDLIQYTSQWGLLNDGGEVGLCRESLTNSDRQVRDWFVQETKSLGCDVKVDEMGNIFAILPGENNSIQPIGMGSHLDSQPAGGRFDGILGVIAALQVLRVIKEYNIKTEGSRFPKMCSGSGVWSGTEKLSECHALVPIELQSISQSADSPESINMATELERIQYLGKTQCSHSHNPLSAHFELHIEQGPLLERTRKKVGVVEGVQGMRWYSINCRGKEAHAGATRMADRADALVVLAKFAVKVEELAKKHDAFGTVGVMRTKTNSINTVPGGAFCTLDLRHWSDDTLDLIESELRTLLKQQEEEVPGIEVSMDRTWCKKNIRFDQVARRCVRDAACATVDESLVMDMISYAGHDSAETAHVVPTAMIFVPSKKGISHNPAEFTTEEDCDIGAHTLLKAVLQYDRYLEEQSHQSSG
ncbi:hypothetical protein TMatcc_000018 [Talaromyces marneffei ATCC 18224]